MLRSRRFQVPKLLLSQNGEPNLLLDNMMLMKHSASVQKMYTLREDVRGANWFPKVFILGICYLCIF
jgi:hypothetical protein